MWHSKIKVRLAIFRLIITPSPSKWSSNLWMVHYQKSFLLHFWVSQIIYLHIDLSSPFPHPRSIQQLFPIPSHRTTQQLFPIPTSLRHSATLPHSQVFAPLSNSSPFPSLRATLQLFPIPKSLRHSATPQFYVLPTSTQDLDNRYSNETTHISTFIEYSKFFVILDSRRGCEFAAVYLDVRQFSILRCNPIIVTPISPNGAVISLGL